MKKIILAILALAAPALPQCGPCTNPLPVREFGQPTLINPNPNSAAPNLVIGEELYSPSGIAFDSSVTPPRVYVVDTGNNRVLGWSNAGSVSQGTPADMVLGQETSASGNLDFTATLPWGPGSANPIGLNDPTGIAVDANGNVYVSDSGNNRILRFVTPYKQQTGNFVVDLVIGQKSVNSGSQGNQGQSSPSASTLYLSIAATSGASFPAPAGLAVDSSGNLWAADVGNNRVLMYPAANLSSNNSSVSATVALGQPNLTSNQIPSGAGPTAGNFLQGPMGVSVDSKGTVYVTDAYARALVYTSPFLGASASTILGIPQAPAQGQQPVYPTQYTLGSIAGGSYTSPQGIFTSSAGGATAIYVADTPQNRVVAYSSLTIPSGALSPAQTQQIGQNGPSGGEANQGQHSPSTQTLWSPVAGAIRPDNGEMWIADQGNNRVVALAPASGAFPGATRVLGQLDYTHNAVNILEGRELWLGVGGGVAFDTSSCSAPAANPQTRTCSNAPYLYVADTNNNRVLGFKNGLKVGVDPTGILTQKADIVIGQAQGDLQDNFANYPNDAVQQPTATGLYRPSGLVVDSHGNLWVADSGNSRVVRFPTPFAQTGQQTADTVLGQASLTAYTPGVSQFSMEEPFGLTLFSNGNMAVSDPVANRILVFAPSGGTFASGQKASYVIGQTGFSGSATGSSPSQLNTPTQLAVDSGDNLYACDTNNGRLLVYQKPTASSPVADGSVPVGCQAVAVSINTGLIWLNNGQTIFQVPQITNFETSLNANQNLQPFQLENGNQFSALAIALDPYDDLAVTDTANRLTFYYDQLYYRNTANYTAGLGSGTTAGPTPTMLAELLLWGGVFNFTPSYTGSPANLPPPFPTTYQNGNTTLQVTVAGIPAPIFRVDTSGVNNGDVLIEIPNEAPSSGPAQFEVTNPTTGQIYAAATFTMQQSSPGIYTTGSNGQGPVAAINLDGTTGASLGINSSSNPIPVGDIIDLWLTGAGYVPGLPADGTAPGTATTFYTPVNPTVYINNTVATVVGSAMSGQFPGVWQINAIVPAGTPPGTVDVIVVMDGFQSDYLGTNGTSSTIPGGDEKIIGSNSAITTIYVKN